MKTFIERFEEIFHSTGLTAYKMAKELDTSEAVISSIRNGKTKPSFDFFSKLLSKYKALNINYLIQGGGSLYLENNAMGNFERENSNIDKMAITGKLEPAQTHLYNNNFSIPDQYNMGMPRIITVNEKQQENIVYVPVKARAGYLLGYGDSEFMNTLLTYRLPGLDNATYRMFEVEGASMSPTVLNGDRVIGQWVNSMAEIRNNRVHILVTKNDGVIVKRIQNHISQHGKIVAKSDTITHRKEYPTIQIDPEEILEIWYCQLKLGSDFSEPAELYHRINNLEADMAQVKDMLTGFAKSQELDKQP